MWLFCDGGAALMRLAILADIEADVIVLSLFSAIRTDALRDCVAVNAKRFRGVRNALSVTREGLLDVELFKLFQGFIQKDVAIEHVFNDSF